MLNLDWNKDYPQLMKWPPNEKFAIAEIVAPKIEIGDEFSHNGRIRDHAYHQGGKVVEIIESREARGQHKRKVLFYKVKIEGDLKI